MHGSRSAAAKLAPHNPLVVADAPGPDVHHAHWRLDELQFWHHAKLFGELGAADDRVEKCRMGGIHCVLHRLQPVAQVTVFRAWHEPIAWLHEAVVHWKRWLEVGRTQIGKDDA